MKIYIDSDYCCHTSNPDEKYREFDVPFFDDKCNEFIEGYRYVPVGESWEREDGVVFEGEMIVPWKDYELLSQAQKEYESEKSIKTLESESEALKEENDALKAENTMLAAQVSALSDQMDFYEECIVEMAEVVYA